MWYAEFVQAVVAVAQLSYSLSWKGPCIVLYACCAPFPAKYPEIKKLYGADPMMKYAVTCVVVVQVTACFLLRDSPWWLVMAAAYLFGGTLNHAMELAVHEISHALAFGVSKPWANRALALFANLPIGVPMAISFRKYHLDHHRYQGDEKIDVDLPTRLEGKLFFNTVTKFIWLFFQSLAYSLRPFFVNPKPMTRHEALNIAIQVVFLSGIYHFTGMRGIVYLIAGSLLAMGVHPVAGHFISEHYMFSDDQETYSYYGPLNMLAFNVGFHMEHHDFPYIPGSRLPQVTAMAPEFYLEKSHHWSWTRVLYDFVTDPNVGCFSRTKRHSLLNRPGSESVKME